MCDQSVISSIGPVKPVTLSVRNLWPKWLAICLSSPTEEELCGPWAIVLRNLRKHPVPKKIGKVLEASER